MEKARQRVGAKRVVERREVGPTNGGRANRRESGKEGESSQGGTDSHCNENTVGRILKSRVLRTTENALVRRGCFL